MEQGSLFGDEEIEKLNSWREEWVGMPEYNNDGTQPPVFEANFKFRNKEDFDSFMEVVKEKLYNGKRVFDGNQLKDKKSAWFPLDDRPSENVYISVNQ